MINPKELRIGNWVINSILKKKVKVSCHTFTEIIELDGQYSPIPIDEKWLKDFGFPFEETINAWTNGYYDILINNNRKFIIDEIYNCPEIEYVHQFQNLYFVLTGKKLTICT